MEQKTCRICKKITNVDQMGIPCGGSAYECNECKERKDRKSKADRAYREKNKESLSLKKKEYYQANSEHVRKKSKLWYEENKDYAIARQLEYVKSRADWYSIYKKEWRVKNRVRVVFLNAKYRLENRDQVRLATSEWLKKYPQKRKEYFHARRTKLQGNGGRFTSDQIDALRSLQKGKCACCRASLKKTGEHIDHIVAVANGGGGDILNIQILCPACNMRKSAKDPIDFMQQNGFLL